MDGFKHHLEVFQMQLYNFVTLVMPGIPSLEGKTVVELGCRRGGGLAYLNSVGQPERAIGVDPDERNIKFCKANYSTHKNLDFLSGESKNLE